MLPPLLVRRLVLAPVVIVLALGIIVASPLLFVLALLFGLAGLLRAGRMRNLRLVSFGGSSTRCTGGRNGPTACGSRSTRRSPSGRSWPRGCGGRSSCCPGTPG